jgi:hypothetical protein
LKESANYSQTLIIPSNMDLHCCFSTFKKVLQTHAADACKPLQVCYGAAVLSSNDLRFGSLNATRDPPRLIFWTSGHERATELNIDRDMAHRLCQRMTLQRHALRPSVNRLRMYCSNVCKILGRNEMQQRKRSTIAIFCDIVTDILTS